MELYTFPGFSLLGTGGAVSNGDTIYIRAVGTTISAGINGVEAASVTDATHTTGTGGGVYSGNTFDDFAITDLSGGGGGFIDNTTPTLLAILGGGF